MLCFRKRPDLDATLEDLVERLGGIPLLGQQGSAWHYGINMNVLGGLLGHAGHDF
ncbi:MAG: hypothetical protein QMC74_18660 [Myxococcota bacterium]